MSDILLASLFLLGFLYNLSSFRKIRFRIYIRDLEKLILGLSFLIFIFITYITRNDLFSYLISLAMTAFFISGICFKGLGNEKFFLTIGRGLVVRKLKYEDIEKISYREKKNKDYFELKIVSKLGVGYERFKNKDKDSLEIFLRSKGL